MLLREKLRLHYVLDFLLSMYVLPVKISLLLSLALSRWELCYSDSEGL